MTRSRAGVVAGLILIATTACRPTAEGTRKNRGETMLRPESGLLGRPDSVPYADLQLRIVGRRLLQYDSAMDRPARSVADLMGSRFAVDRSDLTDVWGTAIRLELYTDPAVLASAGPTRRWSDSLGVRVTAYYGRPDSIALVSRAASVRDGHIVRQEWLKP